MQVSSDLPTGSANKNPGSPAARLLKTPRAQVGLVLILALALRLAHVLIADPWPPIRGGDYFWYAEYGSTLVRTGWTFGPPPTGPLFLLVAGYAEQLHPSDYAGTQPAWLLRRMIAGETVFPNAVGSGRQAVRLLHALLGTLTVLMVYRAGRAAWNHRAGLIAAAALAVGPAFVIESGNLTTETISIFLMTWALALWLERSAAPDRRLMAACGALIGLAAMTRSVFLAFPLVLVLHLLIRWGWRRALSDGAVLLAAFFLMFAPWTLYYAVRWNRFALAGEGLLGTLYVGAVGWQGPAEVDATLDYQPGGADPEADYAARQEAFAQGIAQVILSDPLGYLARRLGELASALLQPHNTVYYPGESIRDLAARWLREDRTVGGLLALTGADAFWPKLLLYAFHYAALILGAVGLARGLRRWRDLWPLYAALLYFLGVHTLLSAIPRYLFPAEPLWWLFAGAAVDRLWAWREKRVLRAAF